MGFVSRVPPAFALDPLSQATGRSPPSSHSVMPLTSIPGSVPDGVGGRSSQEISKKIGKFSAFLGGSVCTIIRFTLVYWRRGGDE